MRELVKQFNELLKKMMHKNYQLLAQFTKEIQPLDVQKQIEILKAEIENSNKVISVQENQKMKIQTQFDDIQGKQDYWLQLIKEIYEVKGKMPGLELISKHQIGGIQKNGFVLVNQEVDQSLYIRLAILRADYERGGERLTRLIQKNKELDEKIQVMEQRDSESGVKLTKFMETVKEKKLDVSSNVFLQELKEKYQSLKKKRQTEQKKMGLFQHVCQTNENNIKRKINDMRKLQTEYLNKTDEFLERIQKLQKDNEKNLHNAKIVKNPPQTVSFKYAETLLKGDKNKNERKSVMVAGNDKNFQLKEENKSGIFVKPKMQIRYKSSVKDEVAENKNFAFEDEQENKLKKPKKNIKNQKQDRKKVNASMNDDIFFEEKKEQKTPEYKISKPSMNLKKKKGQSQVIDDDIFKMENDVGKGQPIGLPRISQKRNAQKKISENEMRSLEERGRQILGL